MDEYERFQALVQRVVAEKVGSGERQYTCRSDDGRSETGWVIETKTLRNIDEYVGPGNWKEDRISNTYILTERGEIYCENQWYYADPYSPKEQGTNLWLVAKKELVGARGELFGDWTRRLMRM